MPRNRTPLPPADAAHLLPGGFPAGNPAPVLAAVLIAVLGLAAPAGAQDHEGPLVPGGVLRLWAEPTFEYWDSRFGRRVEDGGVVEEDEPLGFDLTGDALGSARIPSLLPVEAALRDALADPGYRLDLGASVLHLSRERTVIPFRADVGVTDWLTVGAMVPLVRTQGEAAFALLGRGDVGVSPEVSDPGAVADFLNALGASVADVSRRADEICASEGADDPECVEARAVEADLISLADALEAALGAPLFLAEGTGAAEVLLDRLATLRARAQALGAGPPPENVPLAEAPLTTEELQDLLEDPAFGVDADPLRTARRLWALGDVEISAAVRLLEGGARPDSAGRVDGLRYRIGAGALVRLGTGQEDASFNFVDVGTGDGQTDFEGRVFATLRWGTRWALWTDARYGVQSSRTLRRRIAPPDVLLAPSSTLAPVEWDPGDYLSVEVAPRFHVTEELSLNVRYSFWSKAEDVYTASASPGGTPGTPPPPDPAVLGLETEETRHRVGVGATFSTVAPAREGRYRVPFEARFRYLTSIEGSGGRTPRSSVVEGGLRIYWRLWGG